MSNPLDLTDDACRDFARFNGWAAQVPQTTEPEDSDEQPVTTMVDNPTSAADFTNQVLLSKVQNDLTEQRNRDAIAEAAATPITVDNITS